MVHRVWSARGKLARVSRVWSTGGSVSVVSSNTRSQPVLQETDNSDSGGTRSVARTRSDVRRPKRSVARISEQGMSNTRSVARS